MAQTWIILLTSATTIIVGVFVYVLGQIIQRFILEPIQEQKRIIGKISRATLFHMASYISKHDDSDIAKQNMAEAAAAATELRGLASDLASTVKTIPFYERCSKHGWVVSPRKLAKIRYLLMRWQASMDFETTYQCSEALIKILELSVKIDDLDSKEIDALMPKSVKTP